MRLTSLPVGATNLSSPAHVAMYQGSCKVMDKLAMGVWLTDAGLEPVISQFLYFLALVILYNTRNYRMLKASAKTRSVLGLNLILVSR